jgi:hypothetical protein
MIQYRQIALYKCVYPWSAEAAMATSVLDSAQSWRTPPSLADITTWGFLLQVMDRNRGVENVDLKEQNTVKPALNGPFIKRKYLHVPWLIKLL